MRNYQTDGGSIVNFLTEIDNIDLNDDENICLISNQPLDETHVALKCGHKFNYHSIYNLHHNTPYFWNRKCSSYCFFMCTFKLNSLHRSFSWRCFNVIFIYEQ